MAIKAIIFDLGGPIVEWQSGMYDVYGKHEQRHNLPDKTLRNILQEYMYRGGIGEFHSFPEFIRATKPPLELTVEELNEIFEEGNASMWVRPEMVEYIEKLKQKYPIALLSNFVAGIEGFLQEVFKIYHLFDVIVSSYNVKMRKPDAPIYEYTLKQLGAKAAETVFIDDMPKNVEAAKRLGMAGIVFETSEQCQKDLNALLELGD